MKDSIITLFNKHNDENNLNIKLSFNMPKGYETACGTFDVLKNTLFLNEMYFNDRLKMLFTLYHELRHAEQYITPQKFDKDISESIKYVILYNGVCYKLIDNSWVECKINHENLIDIYLSLPYELDANKFAYNTLKGYKGIDLDELNNYYNNTLPKISISKQKLQQVYNEIDILSETNNKH